ncbi:hypothetical protein PSEUBRA_004828 [Kalmanozyma brasiliensis GHG001]|uniref:Uncharacterized protein n=1 Tax=Kalmanozyma brasiliensis (strain GHG001) TaxID=1365824 RepID=V5E6B1_KALBG|nr:uncharacterized protein PSEUBRA_004828 [Kalmanozyma brasiliensis GHG001]EST05801.1 hypothetical protein PSEUBRA_004828 [Kalmanozyma brasiliensis GHG001]
MGNCMSSKAVVVEEVNPAPHPEARRVWLVSTPVDAKDVPLDLVGIDADGLKAAMRNRGLETEHWALKVDPQTGVKAEPSIIDITVEGGKLVSHIHPTSSPYWKGITRRVAIGWTLWKDDEILEASKLLIHARPKYDGRANNSQQLARLLGRHIDFVPPQSQQMETQTTNTTSETLAGSAASPAASMRKTDSAGQETQSQMTLVSAATLSQRSQSIEESDAVNEMGVMTKGNTENNVSRVPASIRQSQRMSVARPPLIHLSTAPSASGSEVGTMVRPILNRSAETDSFPSPTGSVRMSLPPQAKQPQSPSSPLNPGNRMQRQSMSEIRTAGRARTNSDATAAYATMSAADRRTSTLLDGTARSSRPSRRRSEAPAEWLAELPSANDARFNSVKSRSGQTRNTHRDSIMSSGGGMMTSPSMGTWGHGSGFPASPSMVGLPGMPGMPVMPGMPMTGFGTPPQMSPVMPPMGLPMWPPTSQSMMFNPAAGALQVPMPYFAPQMGMPFLPSMPMLAPPSPGFYSHTSSAVPTPPESPHLSSTHPPKGYVPEMQFDNAQPSSTRA